MLSIPLPEQALRALEAQSKEAGKTPEQFAREVLLRVTKLPRLERLVERNQAALSGVGLSEDDVTSAIESGIEEVRRTRK